MGARSCPVSDGCTVTANGAARAATRAVGRSTTGQPGPIAPYGILMTVS